MIMDIRGRIQRTSGKWGGVILKFGTLPDGGGGGGGGGGGCKFGRPKIA